MELDSLDKGLLEHWEKLCEGDERNGEEKEGLWKKTRLPAFFKDIKELKDISGSVWFRRNFKVSEDLRGKELQLWLGTIVDSDTVYINGVQVGNTDYQYPPRKYKLSEGCLHEGENTVVIRIVVESGLGRFTPDKEYKLFAKGADGKRLWSIDLSGEWEYRAGAVCEPKPKEDFTAWKATGLYNGMTAVCHNYTIKGLIWYQGESNAAEEWDYADLTRRQIEGYRKLWKDLKLPYIYVQLPNFDIDLEENFKWPDLREKQRLCKEIPYTAMVTAIDLGEDNDLHPHGKKEIGRRLALAAGYLTGTSEEEYTGPEPVSFDMESDEKGVYVRIKLSHAEGLYAFSKDKGNIIKDFSFSDKNGNIYPADVRITEEGEILLRNFSLKTLPKEILYCYSNTYRGALIYNGAGLSMSPFRMRLR